MVVGLADYDLLQAGREHPTLPRPRVVKGVRDSYHHQKSPEALAVMALEGDWKRLEKFISLSGWVEGQGERVL